jgi:hypothetical protein
MNRLSLLRELRALAAATIPRDPTTIHIAGGLPNHPIQITVLPRIVIVGGFPRLPGSDTVMPEDRIHWPSEAGA